MSKPRFETLAVHAGERPEEHYGAVSVPIYPSTVFAFPDAEEASLIHNEEKAGYYYGRLGNPTTEALERTISELESAEAAMAFASGMAASSAIILALCERGDHILAPSSMYSTTANMFQYVERQFGIEVTFASAESTEDYAAGIRPNTKIIWTESPSNPVLQITDLRAISLLARERGVLSVADNTFATPYNQRPIELGIDVVVHSATKYLGGHSDLTAGLVVGKTEIVESVRQRAGKYFGGNIAPQIAWLVLRGIRTLALRMERHNSNAYALADMLSSHPAVSCVHYPGLPSHPGHTVARSQMSGYGGMVALDLGTVEAGKTFANVLELCTLATSLGGVETIVQHSASMTHATIPRARRIAAGITDGLLRLSVGVENIDDLKADILQALAEL